MNMQKGWTKWTAEMDAFLIQEFGWIGDTYLADMFAERFPKPYPWTKKHIEKRRSYLGLRRTPEQEHVLRCLNNMDGRHFKAWDKRDRMKDGEVRIWYENHPRKYIKIGNRVVLYGRYLKQAKKGEIVRVIDDDYQVITMAEHAKMNKAKSLSLPKDLQETIKELNRLKKLIYGKENSRPARNIVRHN
jgi:hypothetical protein